MLDVADVRRELKTIIEHTFNLDGQPLPGNKSSHYCSYSKPK